MDFIKSDTKKLYRKYLIASVASAMVMSIYSFVDTIAIGQSEGPIGAAAMAVITPLYGILIFLAILCGVGGSVLMGNAKGEGNEKKGNAYFTASIILITFLAVIAWVAFAFFYKPIFTFFGANEEIMPKVMEYAQWIIWFFPVFIAPTVLSAFIRNDGSPSLAMVAVIVGGCINVLGDWFFVFPMGMGMQGAAIATVIGTSVQVLIMCIHFFTKRCHLKLIKPICLFRAIKKILSIGFGASVLDLGTVFLAIVMNNQIMRFGGTTALAIYGVIATITSLFQALFCGVGQAIQPIVSANCGAKQPQRIKSIWKMSLVTVVVMGVLFVAIGEFFPEQIVRLFMAVTPEIITAAPAIMRPFFIVFLPLGVTVLSTYYLQSILHNKTSLVIAILRSFVVSGLLIFILPIPLGIIGIWLALPISELFVAIVALVYIKKRT